MFHNVVIGIVVAIFVGIPLFGPAIRPHSMRAYAFFGRLFHKTPQ